MQLEHTLSVPAPVDEVWAALLNPEKVAPCMPGASLTGVDGDTFTGTVKVKLGPVALTYKGTGRYAETDEPAHRAVIEANAKDTRGNGTVSATITVTLTGNGDRTDGTVVTDMTITGKPAQFGRGMISDVGGKILEQFADCLSKKLGPAAEPALSEAGAPASVAEGEIPSGAPFVAPTAGATADAAAPAPASTPGAAAPAPEVEPLDLMQYARGSAIQRIVPVVALAVVIAVAVGFFLRRRKH
ncbi:SRPBCC family protein [Rhodococcus chondri]|uniref:SRPBCC family protein n=1 Tax=Rhodococcus chondri TaxID=3065941 RepID=A0ABU7JQ45_9NOCA|nr:SRPBCC family protein [Rhodococcus sp. CC-R104]MEE2032019.1 SRPBCC family protein [Rhodococcus sp. CC-R104]